VLANSVATIDHGYRNELVIRFKYIFQPEDLVIVPEHGGNRIYGVVNQDTIYQKGERVIQLKARKDIPVEFELVDKLDDTVRGAGGFGSSGVN
jgi:dUTPase